MHSRLYFAAITTALFAATTAAHAQPSDEARPDRAAFRELYKELVETNTTPSAGSCTLAAERMAARLKAAGFEDENLNLFSVPEHAEDGGLLATLPGADPNAGAVLMLAHIDVVEAKREDWTRDPFTLIEEDGKLYGRGTADDKAQAAIFTDALARLKSSGEVTRRTLKMALTCGEETEGEFNGAEWLTKEHMDWIAADFAINEGGTGLLGENGEPVSLGFQAGEKVYQDFRIEATNPGGHSSRPRADNAIYDITTALNNIADYAFPIKLSDTTRAYFTQLADLRGGEEGAAMRRLVADPADAEAVRIVTADPAANATLRTTCVATLLDGGHALNALPQRAGANVNCRIYPGETVDEVQAQLAKVIDNPDVSIKPIGSLSPTPPPPPPPLTPFIYDTAKRIAAEYFPDVPILPTMATGATDGRFLNAAGIPTYGVPGAFSPPEGNGAHGLNEYVTVDGLYAQRDYLFDLIRAYANAPEDALQ